MTCNFGNHAKELQEIFEVISSSRDGDEWVIFDYEGNSNIIKVGQSGSGGLDELVTNFNSGKIQYGFASVKSTGSTQRKVVLIHWQGDGVPAVRKANTSSHVDEVKRFVKRVHLTIHARNEEDLDLGQSLGTLTGGVTEKTLPASISVYEPPEPVKSVYTPQKPHQDLDLQEREKFWRDMQDEENTRRKEETKKTEERNRQSAEERKQVEKQLHDTFISSTTTKSPPSQANQLDYKSYAQQPKKGNLITGRTQLFEQKVAELAASAPKPLAKPKNFKYEIKTSKSPGVPVNREAIQDQNQNQNHAKAYENNMANKDRPVFAKIASQPVYEQTQNDGPHRKYPPFTGVKLPSPISPPPLASPIKEKHEEVKKTPSNEFPVRQNSIDSFDDSPPPPPLQLSQAPPPPIPTSNPPEIYHNNVASLPQYEYPPDERIEAPKFTPSQYDFPPEHNASVPQNGINGHKGEGEHVKAVALWDYQAEDDTEITFNPDDVITDIEMVHDGWWQGRGPDGKFGLFPSNYVKII